MKVTAQWIAEQCGVSRGTVDRVVNGRPNVAPEVRERVQKIISEYGYKTPSQRQAARAGHGAFRIGVILPSWDAFFIRRMREGIRVAVHNRGLNDVNVLVEELKNRSHRAYFEAIGHMEERGIDGLIVTAPDTVAMSEEIDRLVAIGIPVVTCDSDVRQSRRLYHIGQNMVKSGRIAAGLLAPYVEGQDVLVVTGNREFTAHGLRVRGFLDRLHEIFDDNVNVNVIESVEQYELTYDGVLQQVRQNPRLRGIYMANESVRGCMDALERAKPNRRIHVVCHDLTPHARQYLEDGRLDFIVDQDFSAQTTRAIEVLDTGIRKIPFSQIRHNYLSTVPIIEAYYMAGAFDKGNEVLEEYAKNLEENITYYLRFTGKYKDLTLRDVKENAEYLYDLYQIAGMFGQTGQARQIEQYLIDKGIVEDKKQETPTVTPIDTDNGTLLQ